MAKTPTSGMGKQSVYKGMVTGGKSSQTTDYAQGAGDSPNTKIKKK